MSTPTTSRRAERKTIFIIVTTATLVAALAGVALGYLKPPEIVRVTDHGYILQTAGTTPAFTGTMLLAVASITIALVAAIVVWLTTPVSVGGFIWCVVTAVCVTLVVGHTAGLVETWHHPIPAEVDSLPTGTILTVPSGMHGGWAIVVLATGLAATWYWVSAALFGDAPGLRRRRAARSTRRIIIEP